MKTILDQVGVEFFLYGGVVFLLLASIFLLYGFKKTKEAAVLALLVVLVAGPVGNIVGKQPGIQKYILENYSLEQTVKLQCIGFIFKVALVLFVAHRFMQMKK